VGSDLKAHEANEAEVGERRTDKESGTVGEVLRAQNVVDGLVGSFEPLATPVDLAYKVTPQVLQLVRV
jgi:hypothetical protein